MAAIPQGWPKARSKHISGLLLRRQSDQDLLTLNRFVEVE
jgi:hypothetical protein